MQAWLPAVGERRGVRWFVLCIRRGIDPSARRGEALAQDEPVGIARVVRGFKIGRPPLGHSGQKLVRHRAEDATQGVVVEAVRQPVIGVGDGGVRRSLAGAG